MTKIRLLSTAAAVALLTAGIASAQGLKKDEQPAPAPEAQQKAPAEKIAPNMNAGQHKPETTGQSTKSAEPDKSPSMKDEPSVKPKDNSAIEKSGATNKSSAADTKENAEAKSKDKAEAKSDNKASTAQDNKAGAAAKSSESTKANSNATTGQGAAGAAKLSTEQRTKVAAAFKEHKVQPVTLNISVSVGTRIPATVHLYPVPVEVVNIYPEWRGFDYIFVGNEIIVIDPGSREIVAIITA